MLFSFRIIINININSSVIVFIKIIEIIKVLIKQLVSSFLSLNRSINIKLLNSECDNDTTVIIVTHNQLIKVIHIKNGEVDKVIINKSKKNIDEVSW